MFGDDPSVGTLRGDDEDLTEQELRVRAGKLVRRRRMQLGLTQQAAAARAKVGSTTWRLIEKGQQGDRDTREATLFRMSQVLKWPDDALERLLAGDSDPDPDRRRTRFDELWVVNPDPDDEPEPPATALAPAARGTRLGRLTPEQLEQLERIADVMFPPEEDE
jgi:transcriptional regulator with XRE-family HTH domain